MKPLTRQQYTLAELIQGLDVTLKGDPDCVISGVGPIQQAEAGQVTFLNNPLYKKFLTETKASAVILKSEHSEGCTVNAIITPNPYFTYAKIAGYFDDHPKPGAPGIHPTAQIGQGSNIHTSAVIGPYCVLGDRVSIGAETVIGAHSILGDNVQVGDNCHLESRVTLYHKVRVGNRTRLASGVVIGSDGFGFANNKGVWHKVPQLGSVTIGDDVEIGANTTIDRGAVEDTVIENGVKLDNLIQIGHNVKIGENTIISGCTGIAGSAIIGKNCMIGGGSCINGHITICDQVLITGMTGVAKSIREPGIYSSGVVGAVPNEEFRRNNARFYRLANLMDRVKSLETALKALTESTKE